MANPDEAPAGVMAAYLSLLLEEMYRLDYALIDFMDEIPDDAKDKLADLIMETAERRGAQATAAYEMVRDV